MIAGGAALRRGIVMAVLAAVAGVALLGVAGWFLTGAALAGLGAAAGFNYLVPSAAIRLAAVVRTGARHFERLWSHEAALNAVAEVRVRLFGMLVARDPREVRDLTTGEGVARLTGDVDALEDAVIRAPARPAALAGGLVAVALALPAGVVPALLLAAGLLALPGLATRVAAARVDRAAADAGVALAEAKAMMVERLEAATEIAVYGLGDAVAADVMAVTDRLDVARGRLARGEALLAGVLVMAGPLLAVLVAGAAALLGAAAETAALAALATVGGAEAQAAMVRARGRAAALAGAEARLAALAGPVVERDAVAGDALVIAGVALAAGERLGLSGPSGSGKTRLLETLAGLRSDAPEALLLGGVAAADLPFAVLAERFALAGQAPVLIAGTVEDNLRLAAPGLDEAALWAALEVACLGDDVRAMPEGLRTWLGEGAGQLSGGQRKRLALARALLAGRRWLLLDEPTEGLDATTEAALVARLGAWLEATGTGLVVASHRPAPLGLAPRGVRLYGRLR